MYTLPNFLTGFRILLLPLFVVLFYLGNTPELRFWTAAVFALAGATDWLDGYLARKMNVESAFGAFLDPVADKLMVIVALVLLVERHASPWLAIPAIIIIGREVTVSALREWMAEIGSRAVVKVSFIAKIKTTVQVIAIILLCLAAPIRGDYINILGYIGLYLAAGLTMWSMAMYIRAAWPYLTSNSKLG